jgi:uncharacterized protein YxeA
VKSTLAITIILVALAGCSPASRFTHVDVDGPDPYVMFDQKTGQLCWAGQDTANGAKVTVTTSNGQETKMSVCGDLVKGLAK